MSFIIAIRTKCTLFANQKFTINFEINYHSYTKAYNSKENITNKTFRTTHTQTAPSTVENRIFDVLFRVIQIPTNSDNKNDTN